MDPRHAHRPFGYAFVNFFLGLAQGSGGAYGTARIFSGHWMLFYGTAFCIYDSAWRQPRLLLSTQCPAGHEVRGSDRYCPQCGLPIAEPRGQA